MKDFGKNGLGGEQGEAGAVVGFDTRSVPHVTAIQQSNDSTGVN
jgi:hypothetical protein